MNTFTMRLQLERVQVSCFASLTCAHKGINRPCKYVLDRVRPFGENFRDFDHLGPFLAIFGPFLGPFWTPKWPREPQNAGGNRPKWAKRGSTGHKNVF